MDIRGQVMTRIREKEYVSFDIFDTLLFRLVRFPRQIFDKTFEKAPWLFPEYLDACEWRELRIYAEIWARKRKKGKEVSLEEIYGELPDIIGNRKEIMELEVETETDNACLNPFIAELLTDVKENHGKEVILISDMYLSREHIARILTYSGLDISMVSRIFVSSEYGETKNSGKLYDRVCQSLGCGPEKILHIGDSWNGDYIRAKKKGIQAIYYPVISEGRYRHPHLDYEYRFYGDVGREIYAVRLLAAETGLEGNDKKWFQMGAMALGPLFTYAAEWVLDTAENNHIRNIYPMMREGYFFTKLLKRAAGERKWDGHIEPVYISRKALYPALLTVLRKKDIDYLLDTRNMTVGTVLGLLRLTQEEMFSQFMEFESLSLCQAKEINLGGKSLYELLGERLSAPEVLKMIREKNKQADDAAWKYFQGLNMDCQDFITFDVGWRGNAQNGLERICKNRRASARGIHLLAAGKKQMVREKNLEDGTDIRGFCGNFGKNAWDMDDFLPPIIELFLLCREGTTVGYEMSEDKAVPVCKEIQYSPQQQRMMEMVQAGILSFQDKLYAICRQKGRRIPQKAEELLKIAVRLTALPEKKEALLIGSLEFDQNFGVDTKQKIISDSVLNQYKRLGYNGLVHQKLAREYEWYRGMDVCIDPMTYYRRIMFYARNGFSYEYGMYAERISREPDTFVLVGAGKGLKELLLYLNLIDVAGKIELIMDNDGYLHGETMGGHRICPLETEVKSRTYVITPFQKTIIAQLTSQLQRLKGPDIKIINLYS